MAPRLRRRLRRSNKQWLASSVRLIVSIIIIAALAMMLASVPQAALEDEPADE
jgi:hypothetical protein